MLYYLFRFLEQYNIPGSHLWSYISFRALLALIFSLVISAWFGEFFIKWMKRRKIFETERDIDNLFKYYAADIPVELMEMLEKIPRSTYHSVMRTLLAAPDDVDFSGAASDPKSNFFVEYYNLIQELRQRNK